MALDQGKLKDNIKKAFDETLPEAIERGLLQMLNNESKAGNDMAKKVADTVNELISEPLAERLSAAIDYYVRTADVHGKIMITGNTVGGPYAQTLIPIIASASTIPVGMGGGNIPGPNTFIFGIK